MGSEMCIRDRALTIVGPIITTASALALSPGGVVAGYIVTAVGSIGFLAVRIVEIVNIFTVVDKLKAEGKVVFKPAIEVQPTGTKLTLGFSYSH